MSETALNSLINSLGLVAPWLAIALAATSAAILILHETNPRTQERLFGIWPESDTTPATAGKTHSQTSQDPQTADRSAFFSSQARAMATRVTTGLCIGTVGAEALFFFMTEAG